MEHINYRVLVKGDYVFWNKKNFVVKYPYSRILRRNYITLAEMDPTFNNEIRDYRLYFAGKIERHPLQESTFILSGNNIKIYPAKDDK